MKAEDFIKIKRLPFPQRVQRIYDHLHSSSDDSSLLFRTGVPPVDTEMEYYEAASPGNNRRVLIFGSNNYLGLSNEPAVKEKVAEAVRLYGLGSGGSPAFSGYMDRQAELEAELARLSGHESAILLAGGYVANLSWITALLESQDVIIYDKNSHASVIDAIKLAGVRHAFTYDTDNPDTLEKILKVAARKYTAAQIFLTIEGVRSIDGSVVNLQNLLDICAAYAPGAFIMLDDAHGLGVLGKKGWGTLEHLDLMGRVDLRMSTCSKALGIQGAFLTGSEKIIAYIRALANPYTFTSAMSVPVVTAIKAALAFIREHPERIARLHENKKYMQDKLEKMGYKIYRAPSGIIPIFTPHAPCAPINRELFRRGLFVNVMAYPMIAPGKERIRLSMMATHTREQLDRALTILEAVGKQFQLI